LVLGTAFVVGAAEAGVIASAEASTVVAAIAAAVMLRLCIRASTCDGQDVRRSPGFPVRRTNVEATRDAAARAGV
jgi:hypothetical protein